MKILFAIPTLFGENKQEIIKKCVNNLLRQCELNNVDCKIVIVCNAKNDSFDNWNINTKKIIKKTSGILYNISASLNIAISEMSNEDYFCFSHDDIIIPDNKWIKDFIHMYEDKNLNCGILGLRPHYKGNTTYRLIRRTKNKIFRIFINQYNKRKRFFSQIYRKVAKFLFLRNFLKVKTIQRVYFLYKYDIEEHSWVDGIMFLSSDIIKKVGKFDEDFFGDCESEDYNYRVRAQGYRIYRVIIPYNHYSTPFKSKVKKEIKTEFLEKIEESRRTLQRKWVNKENLFFP